ncbi:MAG: MBL fold metallo-hydrolase [Bacteroidales bacterium]|nr:MBL fold metallo-hydrolase [Bacteroidales bacterium]
MVDYKCFYFNDLRVGCYLVWDDTRECVIIDPGCKDNNELGRLEKFVKENSLVPVKILLTHGHFDHVMGVQMVADKWDLKVYIHPNDRDLALSAHESCSYFGFNMKPITSETVNISDNSTVEFGATKLKVIHTPGHTQGSVCFHYKKQKLLFCGDTLFAGSIGRTDLPGGNYDQLIESITQKLLSLDSLTRAMPGHGPETTIGYEYTTNPFLS